MQFTVQCWHLWVLSALSQLLKSAHAPWSTNHGSYLVTADKILAPQMIAFQLEPHFTIPYTMFPSEFRELERSLVKGHLLWLDRPPGTVCHSTSATWNSFTVLTVYFQQGA